MKSFFLTKAFADFTVGLPFSDHSRTYTSFSAYFIDLIAYAMGLAIAISVGIVVYAGYLYATSQGEAGQITKAKEWVAGVLTGLAILVFIRLILSTLEIGRY